MNLDLNRANILPDDYDTDLESEWVKARRFVSIPLSLKSKPRLDFFPETNDFPSDTIEERRNRFYQTQMVRTAETKLFDIDLFFYKNRPRPLLIK